MTDKWALGTRVTKTKGSAWTGRIVGFYSTSLTPVGYCVESEYHTGSVQIYPQSALQICADQRIRVIQASQAVIDAERERCAGIVNERDALMQALVAAHEDNLWNEYHTGSVRDGRWTHMFMSDGECLALDCGFDPKNADYPDDAIRAAIPSAAERRAQDALFAIRGSTNEF